MPNSNPKTFSYEIKWLIIHYATGSIDNEAFKEKLKTLLTSFPMTSENAAVCLCKYIFEQEKYGPLSVDDVRHIADLVGEVDSGVGDIVQSWIAETYT